MTNERNVADETSGKLGAYLPPIGAWAFALGASIGWGSLVVTSSTYLAQAGPLGSTLGMLAGLCIMLVIAGCYHFMMAHHPGTGGIYSYTREMFGYDQAVLVAWFLVITYIAMFWANATSLPLFARYFIGDLFQFGPNYTLFGYHVYLGEVMLSVAFIALAGFVCKLRKQGVAIAVVIMALIIAIAVVVCFAGAAAQYDSASFSFEPLFLPDANVLVQVMGIACISSWAFIGFEGVSHSSGEFAFPHKHSFRVLAIALGTITLLYVLLTLLSVMAYPNTYGSWLEYIGDLDAQQGIYKIPAFFAAWYYLGDVGVGLLLAALLCLIFTSLITIIVALSRLFFSMAKDKVIPERFAKLNKNGVPSLPIVAIVLVSIIIPFFGRTAIGWVVDVTTIGATIIYGFVSACALKDGRQRENAIEADCGLIGLVLMVAFALYLLIPGFFAQGSMATESYILLAIWAMCGFIFFRHLLRSDSARRFGKSVISWLMLLALTLFTCIAWMGQMSDDAVNEAVVGLHNHYAAQAGAIAPIAQDEFVVQTIGKLDATVTAGMFVISGMLVLSVLIILSNFTTMRKRAEESHQEAHAAHTVANTDPLTGVKSKTAYVAFEGDLNSKLEDGVLDELGVVVCDVNGLKQVNDTQGHKAGDAYIKSASELICGFYKHSPVFRIGGDEFVVMLQGADYENREQILAQLDAEIVKNRDNGAVVIACGMSVLNPNVDKDIHAIFERADAAMYQRKRMLKSGAR